MSRATALVAEFGGGEAFGAIRAVRSEDVPEPARGLLDHRSHMTVAMERFHGTQVRLRVVATNERQGPGAGDAGGGDARRPGQRPWYAREILLETPDDR
ncbi:MAG: hypothetical protein EBX36_11065, partial [Planctomycetia bacterium]|nr:hypothetical protein [Planctomycetia bacterium]